MHERGGSPSSRRAWIEIPKILSCQLCRRVALLAEGVDRNVCEVYGDDSKSMSPSSRRAWIEILLAFQTSKEDSVALLAEGVDRNRASGVAYHPCAPVALLAEGVDRNIDLIDTITDLTSRPPRGGRG